MDELTVQITNKRIPCFSKEINKYLSQLMRTIPSAKAALFSAITKYREILTSLHLIIADLKQRIQQQTQTIPSDAKQRTLLSTQTNLRGKGGTQI